MIRFPEARPRKGFTLTEVLMAMFVMAIGMISLLALFPAAFQQAKWALDNEQVARAAANAQSMTEMPHMTVGTFGGMPLVSGTAQSVRNDDTYRPETVNSNLLWKNVPVPVTSQLGRTYFLFDSAAGAWTFNTNLGSAPVGSTARVRFPPVLVDPAVASIPSYVDTAAYNGTLLPFHIGAYDTAKVPFGLLAAGGTGRISVGVPRFSMSQYTTDTGAIALRMQTEISMGDEINFDTNGQPLTAAGQFARQRRFSWAYLCNWNDYKTPEICEVTAVVFNSRPDFIGTFPAGEVTYNSTIPVSSAAGIDAFGRVFVKGLTQAVVKLPSAEPMKLKTGDWIFDNTFILPEYNDAFPLEKVPFLDTYDPAFAYTFPSGSGNTLHPGLVGGHFYKVLDISEVRREPFAGQYYQTITIDRPAKSDGFSATIFSGIADVITKSVGKMPQR
ncbi:MAG TPA: prepilin-type N-terminal cleavage/methylation domain-containing protein [Gemmatales bacterium]|nr:prepilin-type N-terminal cleavage/methylation domain-containing protein [Gemmatales bacterium]